MPSGNRGCGAVGSREGLPDCLLPIAYCLTLRRDEHVSHGRETLAEHVACAVQTRLDGPYG